MIKYYIVKITVNIPDYVDYPYIDITKYSDKEVYLNNKICNSGYHNESFNSFSLIKNLLKNLDKTYFKVTYLDSVEVNKKDRDRVYNLRVKYCRQENTMNYFNKNKNKLKILLYNI